VIPALGGRSSKGRCERGEKEGIRQVTLDLGKMSTKKDKARRQVPTLSSVFNGQENQGRLET